MTFPYNSLYTTYAESNIQLEKPVMQQALTFLIPGYDVLTAIPVKTLTDFISFIVNLDIKQTGTSRSLQQA